jgi:hypothetical protein
VFSSAAGIECVDRGTVRTSETSALSPGVLGPHYTSFIPCLLSFPLPQGHFPFPSPSFHFPTFLPSPSLPLPPQTMLISSFFLTSLLATFSFAHTRRSQHPPRSFSPGFPYGSQKVRGVNLGGWLLIEVRYCPSPPPRQCILISTTDDI